MPEKPAWDANLYDDRHAFVWERGADLLDLLAAQPGERVLDLGCGTGHLTARLAAAGARVVGLDHSAEMLARARATYPQLTWIEGDARDFAFDEPFDAVLSNAVLHWVRPPEAAARCIRAALRPGGRFIAELGGHGNVARIRAAARAGAERLGLTLTLPDWYYPTIGAYATLLEAAGLEVRQAQLFDRPTPLKCPAGLRDWLRMFGSESLAALAPERRDEFLAAVEDEARPALERDGVWIADYRRLRVVAVRSDEP